MALVGFVLFIIVSAISVIYPLRFLMIPNRLVAICGVVLGLAILGSAAPTAQPARLPVPPSVSLHTPVLPGARTM
jgi:hypothetical protein